MKKELILIGILIMVFSGCIDETVYYKNTNIVIPQECAEFKNDTCGVYECMTSNCWCKSNPLLPFETFIPVNSEQDAMNAVNALIAELKFSEITDGLNREILEIKKSNELFYSVTVNAEGFTEQYFVAVDGTVIQTVCGV
jgi:hypothetical protein